MTSLAASPPAERPAAAREVAQTRIVDLIERALEGQLPRDREPRAWEPQTLTPLHINMVLDRVNGHQLTEIAERWDYTPAQVANVLGSPDAQTIISTFMAMQAGVLFSMEERFKTLAPEALNVKVDLMRDPEAPPYVRNAVASDILDRAGYAPRKREEHVHSHQILLPAQAATGLRAVLEESRRVATVDYARFLQKPDGEVALEHLQVEAGHPPVDGAPPVPPTALESLESLESVA